MQALVDRFAGMGHVSSLGRSGAGVTWGTTPVTSPGGHYIVF